MIISPNEPKGIGGWLILPLISLFIMPLRLIHSFIYDYLPLFQEGYWQLLMTPGSEVYHELWAPLLSYEIAGNMLLIIFSIYLIFPFYSKSHRLPLLFIVYMAFNLFFVVSDYIFAGFIPFISEEHDPESFGEVFKSIIAAAIWIPYFLVSKRVKNTFVN